jgi:hypothetical protein
VDDNGRYIPVVDRFAYAEHGTGLKPLADYIHSLGPNFGIHIRRGIQRETAAKNLPIAGSLYRAAEATDNADAGPWSAYNCGAKKSPAGQACYDSIASLYASSGVDFVKADCISGHPYKPNEIRMLSVALKKSRRSFALSLFRGPTSLQKDKEAPKYAEMWRITKPGSIWPSQLVGCTIPGTRRTRELPAK